MRKDGDKEVINGKETGLIWSSKYRDFILPDLDQKKEYFAPIAAKNIEICYTCDRWNPVTRQCMECGCFMDVKRIVMALINKTLDTRYTTCPLGKW
tara:strand:- start:1230 stop:1517 length:288 start_codon:yes stop_codon:yes gene_type:complete